MKLSELKNGAIVQLRNGYQYIKIDDFFVKRNHGFNISINEYNEDLLCINEERNTGFYNSDYFDVMKVNNNVEEYTYGNKTIEEEFALDKWTWVRPILTLEEREMLQSYCKNYEVKDFTKRCCGDSESIIIEVRNCFGNREIVSLPQFKRKTKFQALEVDSSYPPERLGLEK